MDKKKLTILTVAEVVVETLVFTWVMYPILQNMNPEDFRQVTAFGVFLWFLSGLMFLIGVYNKNKWEHIIEALFWSLCTGTILSGIIVLIMPFLDK